MQLFLEKLNIKSYRVSSEMHIWNALYLNNEWLNLDLTWDDPVASDGENYLEHNYFLIDTATLLRNNDSEHTFDKEVFQELKEA
jgi:transglutaminase/protease-like cytokinesis protein 3